jgi:hypothetical protein
MAKDVEELKACVAVDDIFGLIAQALFGDGERDRFALEFKTGKKEATEVAWCVRMRTASAVGPGHGPIFCLGFVVDLSTPSLVHHRLPVICTAQFQCPCKLSFQLQLPFNFANFHSHIPLLQIFIFAFPFTWVRSRQRSRHSFFHAHIHSPSQVSARWRRPENRAWPMCDG